ncbi:DUF3310 domain-containing protein [Lagierella sp. ICN-221743]
MNKEKLEETIIEKGRQKGLELDRKYVKEWFNMGYEKRSIDPFTNFIMGILDEIIEDLEDEECKGCENCTDCHCQDNIKQPSHYKLDGLNVESIDVIKAVLGKDGFKSFCIGNCLKYLIRAEKKNGLEDYRKCKVYLDWILEE